MTLSDGRKFTTLSSTHMLWSVYTEEASAPLTETRPQRFTAERVLVFSHFFLSFKFGSVVNDTFLWCDELYMDFKCMFTKAFYQKRDTFFSKRMIFFFK